MSTASDPTSSATAPKDAKGRPLDDRQKAQLDELKKTDADVRRHEQAHLSAAGGLARGGIVLNYKPGPDGKLYAVGGHVDIDTSPVKGDPTATLAKMATVQRAALAPADPSGQDRAVAVQAQQTANKARAELARQGGPKRQQDQTEGDTGEAGTRGAAGATGATGDSPRPRGRAGAGGDLTLSIGKGLRTPLNRMGPADPGTPGGGAGQLVDVMG